MTLSEYSIISDTVRLVCECVRCKVTIFAQLSSVTCDIDQFSNGVAPHHRPQSSSKTRHWPESHPVVLRGGSGGGGLGGGADGGGGGWFSLKFEGCLLSVEGPPGGFCGGFSRVLVSFNLVESEAVVVKEVVISSKRGDRRCILYFKSPSW